MIDPFAIRRELELMVHARLFGTNNWLADRDTMEALDQKIEQMGLDEIANEDGASRRLTLLGKALNFDLAMVFLGMWDEWAATHILHDHGLISDEEWDLIDSMMGAGGDAGAVLLPIVRIAYQRRHNPMGWYC